MKNEPSHTLEGGWPQRCEGVRGSLRTFTHFLAAQSSSKSLPTYLPNYVTLVTVVTIVTEVRLVTLVTVVTVGTRKLCSLFFFLIGVLKLVLISFFSINL